MGARDIVPLDGRTSALKMRPFQRRNEIQTHLTAFWRLSESFICHQQTQVIIVPSLRWLKSHRRGQIMEPLSLCWLNLTCVAGIVGREGFQLLSVSVAGTRGDGTMGRRPLSVT